MFSLISPQINGWENNGEAGGLRRHRAHYDVAVMMKVAPATNGDKIAVILQTFLKSFFLH